MHFFVLQALGRVNKKRKKRERESKGKKERERGSECMYVTTWKEKRINFNSL